MCQPGTYKAFISEIPDYRSNITNWVDCYFIEGNMQIIISALGNGVELVFKVPAQFSGGIGTVELFRTEFLLGLKRLTSSMSEQPLIVRCNSRSTDLKVYCFGRYFDFKLV